MRFINHDGPGLVVILGLRHTGLEEGVQYFLPTTLTHRLEKQLTYKVSQNVVPWNKGK